MKKIIKIFAFLILIVITGIITVNLLLYFTYHFDVEYLTKTSHDGYDEYRTVVDTYECGMESQTEIIAEIYPDSTGKMIYTIYDVKIDGNGSADYTLRSLIPYDRSIKYTDDEMFVMDKQYIKFKVYSDTLYRKYKIEDDKLYLDKYSRYYPYEMGPDWGFIYNESLRSFADSFAFWKDIYYFYQDWRRK